MENVLSVLKQRGLIDDVTHEDELINLLYSPTRVYCGFDPTADSLHLGNLVAIMGLAWFQKLGHAPFAIVGGATGMIGDPSGRSQERNLLSEQDIAVNLEGIKKNLLQVLDSNNKEAPLTILNNFDWYKGYGFIPFLRDIGKLFRIGPMLAKDSVKKRMESEEGMSYTEFSYQILQGYDFLHLHDTYGVQIELGGSDQWGNITAGIELVRKVRSKTVYGITFPLLTRSDGKKFGKSESGAIWLSPEKLSPYEFYQHVYRFPDADIPKLLRALTFLPLHQIAKIEESMQQSDYQANTAQKILAEEVTKIVHGQEGLDKALKATAAAKPGGETKLDGAILESISADIPTKNCSRADVVDQKLVDLLALSGLVESKGEARRLVRNGGAYLNNEKISDENFTLEASHLIDGKFLLLGSGKKTKLLVRIEA